MEYDILDQGISRLNNFSIDSESTKFARLVEDIRTEFEFKDEKETIDDLFRESIRYILADMKKVL